MKGSFLKELLSDKEGWASSKRFVAIFLSFVLAIGYFKESVDVEKFQILASLVGVLSGASLAERFFKKP